MHLNGTQMILKLEAMPSKRHRDARKNIGRLFTAGPVIALLASFSFWFIGSAWAQDVQKIACVVNDEVISYYDLNQRLALVMASTGTPDSPELRRQMRTQVLESLVDEKLELQEAREHEIEVSDDEIKSAIQAIGQQNNLSDEEFIQYLRQAGVSEQALANQVKADLAWNKVINQRLAPRLTIGDNDIEAVIDRIKASAGQFEYLVSEIFLIVNSPDQDAAVLQSALRMVGQLRSGAPFFAIARQFSEGATAAVGGDVGWIQEGQLSEAVGEAASKMSSGEISEPIRTAGGYYIIGLRDRRRIMSADPDEVEVELKQIIFELPSELSETQREAFVQRVETRTGAITNCDQITSAAVDLGAKSHDDLGSVKIGDLPANIRAAVENQEVGTSAKPIITDGSLRVLLVCGRITPNILMPSYDAIASGLEQQRLSMMARRLLRDLRRDSIVDIRE